MWTTDNNHGAQTPVPHRPAHARRRVPDDRLLGPLRPRLAQRQPAAVRRRWARRSPTAGRRQRPRRHYLGPGARRRPLHVDPANPLPFAAPGPDDFREEQRAEFALLGRLNRLPACEYPDDPALRRGSSRTSWPSACRPPCPRCCDFDDETAETQQLYGLDHRTTRALRPADAWRPGGWSSAASGSSRSSTAPTAAPASGTPTAASRQNHSATVRPGRQANRRPAEGPEAARPAGRDARRLGHRVRPHPRRRRAPTAATTTPTASPSGWPAAASRGASSTAPPTSSASTPSRIATTSPTSTPPSCTSSASTRGGSKSPATSAWRSTTASRFVRLSREASPRVATRGFGKEERFASLCPPNIRHRPGPPSSRPAWWYSGRTSACPSCGRPWPELSSPASVSSFGLAG